MDTPSCTAELKPTIMRSKDNRPEITKSAEQFSLMLILKEEGQTLGLRILRITIRNPDTGITIVSKAMTKMASTQTGTEIQIHSIIQIDRATLEPTDQSAGKKLSITSMPDQRNLIVITTETSHKTTIYLRLILYNLLTTTIKMW